MGEGGPRGARSHGDQMPSKPAQLTAVLFTGLLASSCLSHPGSYAGAGGTVVSGSGGAGSGAGGASGVGGAGSGGRTGGGGGAGGALGGGGAGTGGMIIAGTGGALPSRGPTPPHDGMSFPFPQNRE